MYQRRPIAATTPSSPHNVSPAERRTTRPHHHNVQDNTTFIHNPAPRNVSPTNTSLTHSLNMPDTMSLSRSYPSMKSPLLSPSRIPVRTRANTLPASSRAELQYTHTDFIAEIEEMQRLQAENARLLEQNSRVNGITEAYAELGMRSEAQEMTIHVLEQCLQSSDGDLKAARDEVVRMSDDLIRTQHINAMLGEQLEAAQKIVEKHKEREKDLETQHQMTDNTQAATETASDSIQDLHSIQKAYEAREEQYQAQAATISNLSQQVEALQAQLHAEEEASTHLRDQLSQALSESTLHAQASEAASTRAEVAETRLRLSEGLEATVMSELANVCRELDRLRAVNEEQDDTIARLSDRLRRNQAHLEEMAQTAVGQEEILKELEAQLHRAMQKGRHAHDLETQLQQRHMQLDEARVEAAHAEAVRMGLREELARVQASQGSELLGNHADEAPNSNARNLLVDLKTLAGETQMQRKAARKQKQGKKADLENAKKKVLVQQLTRAYWA